MAVSGSLAHTLTQGRHTTQVLQTVAMVQDTPTTEGTRVAVQDDSIHQLHLAWGMHSAHHQPKP